MVEGATETPGLGQMDRPIAAVCNRQKYTVRRCTEADGASSTKLTWDAAEHRKARRGATGGDHVLRVTVRPARVHLDVVARTARDVLDLQRSHHRSAVFGARVTGQFRQSVWSAGRYGLE